MTLDDITSKSKACKAFAEYIIAWEGAAESYLEMKKIQNEINLDK